jgi:aminomethyltransferase
MANTPLPETALNHTELHDTHEKLGAKMGGFAGYDMPLYYPEGVVAEHNWTRNSAGLFDVSHMGQIIIDGQGSVALLERLTPSNFTALKPGVAKYTVLMNAQGGVIDDLIVTRINDTRFFAVINAGCKDKDIAWLRRQMTANISLEVLKDRALLALQGPKAEAVLKDVLGIDAADMNYMRMVERDPLYISRLGYTGEDGFELSVPVPLAIETWNKLLGDARVKPVGLAARDTLRLEMQYCLYGHELDETISPLEADLGWVMRKGPPQCLGAERLEHELANGVTRLRIGVKLLEKGVAREGSALVEADGNEIGMLTSGGFSPSLQTGIGIGFVAPQYAIDGASVGVKVRDRVLQASIATSAFVPAKTKTVTPKAA